MQTNSDTRKHFTCPLYSPKHQIATEAQHFLYSTLVNFQDPSYSQISGSGDTIELASPFKVNAIFTE